MAIYSDYTDVESALTLLSGINPTEPRLFLLNPAVVFAARVVLLDPAQYPISFVAYDTVTVGAYTDIKPGMTILLGSSAGADDYGRQRVRGPESPATAISIFVGRSSQGVFDGELTIVNDAYITIWDERRLWAKMPFIDGTGAIFVDSDLEVGDRTTLPPPVAVMGQGFGGTVNADTGLLPVAFNGQHSYAVADGATIVSFLWEIGDGSFTGGSGPTDDFITTTFEPGFRYVRLTVTDSNGKTGYTERPVVADDLDHSLTFDAFTIESESYDDAGKKMTIRALEDMPRATYPDGALAMMWSREPVGELDRTHMSIIGWLDSEEASHSAGRTGLLRDTTLTILDVAAKSDTLPGFAQAIADDQTRDTEQIPDITWNYMVSPTMDKWIHYLWAWFSNLLDVTDVLLSGTGDAYAIAIKTSDGESLWNQVSRVAQAMCPGFVLTCDQAGAIRVVPDPQLQDVADRTAVVQATITEDDWSDLRYTRQRAPRTHWLRTGALVVQSSISFNPIPAGSPEGTRPTVNLPTVFSIAPGDTPGQGLGEVDYNEQLAADQATLNAATGHRYARMNAAIGLITITLIQDDGAAGAAIPWHEIEPAYKEWVVLTVSAETAAQRGWPFTTIRCLPKGVTTRNNQTRTGYTRTIEVTLEPETSGQPGATVIKPIVPAPGDQPATIPDPIPPPDDGLVGGQDLVAGIGQFGRYRTFDFTTPSGSGGPTWEFDNLTGSDEILTWVVDPFSPGYLTGVGSIDGWAATATAIYRITDIFGATDCNAILTFPTVALWRTIQASFGTFFVAGLNPWLICISYYGDAMGHTGTYATYSKDGGVTWSSEVLVSAEYDSGGASNPIGLYCSPKTPGLAYTVAHNETADPAETGGYKSVDWGATWTAMTATEDPDFPLPYFATFAGEHIGLGGTIPDNFGSGAVATAMTIEVGISGSVSTRSERAQLIVAAPINTKQMTISGHYEVDTNWTGFGSVGVTFTPTIANGGPSFSRTTISDVNNGAGGNHTHYVRDFVYRYDFGNFAGSDWPKNRDIAEPLASSLNYTNDTSVRFTVLVFTNATGTTDTHATLTITVDEIVLDDGTVYAPSNPGVIVPIHGQGGEIHIPWPSNADEGVIYYGSLDRSGSPVIGLQRVDAGVVTDISMGDYGINSGHFAIRTHDSDRSFALLAGESGAGNSGVWVSSDGGDAWDEVVTPSAVTPYQAAFGGDSEQIVFVWGPSEVIMYSEDFGATLDDRSGNLTSLSATKLIGIAGGPTP